MADQEFKYPKARIAQGAGDLIDAYDVTLAVTDNRKSVSTLRMKRAGHTEGAREAKLDFKSYVSELGFERDWLGKWRKDETVSVKVKLPGKTLTVTGTLTNPQVTGNVDNAIEFSISVLGTLSFSEGLSL